MRQDSCIYKSVNYGLCFFDKMFNFQFENMRLLPFCVSNTCYNSIGKDIDVVYSVFTKNA